MPCVGLACHVTADVSTGCLSFSVLHLAWWSLVAPLLLQMDSVILYYGWVLLHRVCVSYHIYFVHCSVDEHLGCFHVFVNSAAVSITQFSRSVVSNSSRPHGLQHARHSCPSPTPGARSNSCLCHPTISSSVVPLLPLPSVSPRIRVFSNESVLHIRWPKYWSFSFSISPSNETSGLISFRMD